MFGLYPAQDTGVDSFEYRREIPHRRSPLRPTSPSCNVFVSNVSGAWSICQLCTYLYVCTYVCTHTHSVHECTYVYVSGFCVELLCVHACTNVHTNVEGYVRMCIPCRLSALLYLLYSVYIYVPIARMCAVGMPCVSCVVSVNLSAVGKTCLPLRFSWSTVLVGRS